MTEFHAGDTVGGYRLEARLGGGGFGTVWRARRVADGMLVALKLLPENGADDARVRADVELLAAAAAGDSSHVVQVLDGGLEPVPFVAMEFIQGTSLAEELRQRQRLSQQETVEIGLGIADALQALNAVGITHRDVKPSNVMIDRNGVVKLTDFGIAKIAGFDAVTMTGQLPLSIAYAAPEVWEGAAEHRSDLYALAIVLYQCLTGQLPFRGAYAELFYQHRAKDPDLTQLPPGTAPSLVELISACLEKAPEDRPRDASMCIRLLVAARGELPAPGTALPPLTQAPQRFGPWVREEPVEGESWAWHCRHETTGEEAIVEVHFGPSIETGEALRRAVLANEGLVPLGAERLLQTNRLILRPGETWQSLPGRTPGAFQFWVAREDVALPPSPSQVTPMLALRAVEALGALIDAANDEGLPLDLDARELTLLPDGTLFLRHPGFPQEEATDTQQQALAYLRGLPLTREVRPLVARATRLDDLRRGLAALVAVRPVEELTSVTLEAPQTRPSSESQRRVWIAALGGVVALTVVAVIAGLLLLKDGSTATPPDGNARLDATPVIPISAAQQACLDFQLPAPITAAESACGGGVAAFAFDTSCPRGQACNRRTAGAGITLGINDRTVALIDGTGNLAVLREGATDPERLTNHGLAQQPAWSPDGRYLAYLVVLPLQLPPATPEPGQTAAPSEPRFATQLHIIEVERPANEGIVFASNGAPNAAAGVQRYASSPQWSADGKTLYFVSMPVSQPGGVILGVEIPMRGDDVDFARLRSGLLANETLAAGKLSSIALNGLDFGQPAGFLGRFVVRPDGQFVVQVCEGERARLSCGLGRWDGKAARLVPTERDVVVEPPVTSPADGMSYAYASKGSDAWLLRIAPDGALTPLEGKVPVTEAQAGAWFAVRPHVAVNRNGGALLIESAGGRLTAVSLADGSASAWGPGVAPVWYTAGLRKTPAVPAPAAAAFLTPTPEPSVTPTPLATPRPVPRQMTLNLSVRREQSTVAGATVVALVSNEECARGNTDLAGRLTLMFPREGAPARCSEIGAPIRFQVNGQLVDQASFYSPQGSFNYDLLLR